MRYFLFLFVLPAMAGTTISEQFYDAIRRDDAAAVQNLLKSADVNLKDSKGDTPLMYAVAVGSETMTRRLIDAGADVNVKNSFDATPLMWASGSLARVQLLVSHGADVNARSKQGHTPVLLACSYPGGLEVLKVLLAKGATLNIPPDSRAMTPMGAASNNNDVALMKFLLQTGGKGALAGPAGAFGLLNAASFGNVEMVKALLAKGVDVNVQSPPESGRVKNGPIAIGSLSALVLAVSSGSVETVRALLDGGAKIDLPDVRGMTPLMLAVATDHPNQDIIRLLLERGADPKVKSKAGETALDWALKFRNPPVLAAIRTASKGITPASNEKPAMQSGANTNVRAALEKSIAIMQTSGTTNFREGGCVSCHGGNMVTIAAASATRSGVKCDVNAASEMARATLLQFAASADGFLERTDPPVPIILSYALEALAEEGVKPDRTTDAMVMNIAAQQLATGYWAYAGIMRPPTADNLFSATASAIRAFRVYAPPARKQEFEERIARAAHALTAGEPSTTEDRVMQLLGLQWAGSHNLERYQKNLIALQRPDGGWAQTQFLSSDSYATGTTLHALHASGLAADSTVYRKGVEFLLKTQAADGSWHVASRAPKFQPYFEGGFPYGHDQWISQWGTGWATVALSHALPNGR